MLRSKEVAKTFNALPDGIAIADKGGRLCFVNSAAERILGIGLHDTPPEEWAERYGLFLPDQKTPFPAAELPLARAVQGESVNNVEMFVRNPSVPGGVWISVNGQPLTLTDDDGTFEGGIAIFRDITSFKNQELDSQELAAIVESSDDAIISKSLDGIVRSWNRGAERLFGYTAKEMIGKPVSILLPSARKDEEPEILGKLKRGERIDHYETARLTKDGRQIEVSLTVSPVLDRMGNIVGASKTIRDITERKHADDALRAAKEDLEVKLSELAVLNRELAAAQQQAQAASKLKSEFVANMSHEIRTPMNGIIGMCNVLLKTSLDDRQREFANAIKTAGSALLTVINDILDFSKIESGRLELEIVDFDLVRVVEGACEILATQARSKDLSLMSFVDPMMPQRLRGDPERLRQILINLTSNAIKFSKAGEIVVRASVDSIQGNVLNVLFSVVDNGIGLSQQQQERLFQPFSQADGSITCKFGGTGLGLSISKRLVELMDGNIGVESSEGKGSTFWFSVPLEPRSEAPVLSTKDELHGVRVLIIDDEPHARSLI
jgi:PAS domain S-box-containing protein